MLPSEPVVIDHGLGFPVGIGNSVTAPCGVILPISPLQASENQRFPSPPSVIPVGPPGQSGSQ